MLPSHLLPTLRVAVLVGVAALAAVPGTASAPVPAGLQDVAVLGTEGVQLKKDAAVASGDVVANDAGAAVTINMNATTAADGAVRADTIFVKNGATPAGSYFCNDLDDKSGSAVCSPQTVPVYPALPAFETATPGGDDVDVPQGGSATLGSGSYGALTVGMDATLVLSGGSYDFTSIVTGNGAQIRFDGPAAVRVAGTVHTGHDNVIGPADTPAAPTTAADLVLYVSGSDPDGDAGVHVGQGSDLAVNVYAPNATVMLKKDGSLEGAVLALFVVIEGDVTVSLNTAFRNFGPAATDDAITVLEGGSAASLVGGATSLLTNDSDPNNDGLFVTTTPVTAPAHGALVLAADGTFLYTHDGSETTVDSFVYEVCDDGVAPGPLCATATVAIAITPVNDPPTAVDDAYTVDEGAVLNGSVLDNDSDAEGDTLTVTATPVLAPTNGSLALNGDGTFVYTHDGSETTSDSFVYEVCDDGADSPGPLCSSATVSITVVPVNDDPTADPQSITVGFPVTVTLTGSDPEGAALTFSILNPPAEGTVGAVTPAGPTSATVLYSPPISPDGDLLASADAFDFQVDDGEGGSDVATVSITLVAANSPPVTFADTIRVSPGGTATTLLSGSPSVLANDFDPDGDGLSVTPTPVSGPSNGSLTLAADGTFSYTHANNGSLSDAFVYQVCDDGSPQECTNGQVAVQVFAPTITVSLTFEGDGTGSVASSPAGLACSSDCSASFTGADRVLLLTSAGPDSVFAGFGGDPDCLDGTLEADTDKACTVTFDEVEPPPTGEFGLTITRTGTGTGTVLSDPAGIDCGSTCTATFPAFQRIDLDAIPDADSVFVGWSGSLECQFGSLTRLPGENASCVATFDLAPTPDPSALVTVTVVGNGSVTSLPDGILCTSNSVCSAEFTLNSQVTLGARSRSGSFLGWSGDCSGTFALQTLTVDGPKSCTANFTP